MSNYFRKTKNPETGKFEVAEWIDNYFGNHQYGVRFGATTFKESSYDEWEFDDSKEAMAECQTAFSEKFPRGNTEPTEVRSAEGSLPKSPTSIEELDRQVREIISFVLLDGQNQIHDLKDGTATPEEVTERMFKSLDYHTPKLTALIEAERRAGAVEELKRLKVDSNGYGGDTAYYEAPFYVVPQSEIDARLAELEGEK